MQITRTNDGIRFYSAHNNFNYVVPFGYLVSVQTKTLGNIYKLVVTTKQDGTTNIPATFQFEYSDVTLPVSSSAAQLALKITAMDNTSQWPEIFTALASQTTFVIKQTLENNVQVFVDGVENYNRNIL